MSVSHLPDRRSVEELQADVHRTLATIRTRALNVQIEGAVDYAIGRPFDANPYAHDFQPAFDDWAAGWQSAASLFPPERLRRQRAMTQERWPS